MSAVRKNTHRMCISGLRTSVYSDTLNRVRHQAYSVSLSNKQCSAKRFQCLRKIVFVLTAGLCKSGLAAAATFDKFGCRANNVRSIEASLDKVFG